MTHTHKKRLNEKTLSLNVLLITLILLSVAAGNKSLPIIKSYYTHRIRINIIRYIFLYNLFLTKFGEYLMHFFIVYSKHLLGDPLFTLFIRSFYISDDG